MDETVDENKLKELVTLGNQKNMLISRYNMVLNEVQKLIRRMANEHLMQARDIHIYMINNLNFIITNLHTFNLKKCKTDISCLQKNLDNNIDELIKCYMN